MWTVFTEVTQAMGTSVEWLVMIILLLGSLTFFAVNFQKGLVALIILCMGTFVWFYAEGLNYGLPLIILLMDIAMMALTLYLTKSEVRGGVY